MNEIQASIVERISEKYKYWTGSQYTFRGLGMG